MDPRVHLKTIHQAVLKAMGIPEEEIECSVRISWGPDTSENELKENLVKLIEIAKQIKG